eukprot:TRINITY_DN62718_c0_g1_i1.p1 TRINITY_DN62718_c0_g1~~TRINITY_DN62718_c0_g1_i1.p1  ORF type:complete len:703 (-),score=194.80 TRINITY_DN62718_c0_g1_i1:130-2238(-)
MQQAAAAASASGNARLRELAASAHTLRQRAYHVIEDHEFGEAVHTDVVDSMLLEARRLIAEIKPTAEVAKDFRGKWEQHKRALVSRRESEIAEHLRQECEAVYRRAEDHTEEELVALSREAHRNEEAATQELAQRLTTPLLDRAVESWRGEVQGGHLVREGPLRDRIRQRVERIATWACEEEDHILRNWEKALGETLAEVNRVDAEAFSAMETMHKARCRLLDETLRGKQKELVGYKKLCKEQLNKIGDDFAAPRESEAPCKAATPKAPPPVQKAYKQVLKERIAVAEARVRYYCEEQTEEAMAQMDAFAAKERAYMSNHDAAMIKVKAELTAELEARLGDMSEQVVALAEQRQLKQEALRERAEWKLTLQQAGARRPTWPREAGHHHHHRQHSPGSPHSQSSSPQSPPTAFGGRTAAASSSSARLSAPPVRHKASFSIAFGREEPDESEGESDDEDLDEPDEAMLHQEQEILRLRKELQDAQDALLRDDCSEWRSDLDSVIETGAAALKAKQAAIGAKAKVLRRGSVLSQADSAESPGSTNTLVSPAALTNGNTFAQDVHDVADTHCKLMHDEFARIRNLKVALSRGRAGRIREAQQLHNWEVLDFEDQILPAVSRLAHEAETAIEVDHALKRGVERIPVAVIASAWKRAFSAVVPIMKHLWDGAGIEEAEREPLVAEIIDALSRAPTVALPSVVTSTVHL